MTFRGHTASEWRARTWRPAMPLLHGPSGPHAGLCHLAGRRGLPSGGDIQRPPATALELCVD